MESYLGGAASVQNRGAKLQGRSLRERCQGAPAMGRREEAGSLDLAGGPLSPNEGRVSVQRTKPSLLVPRSSRPTTNAVCWLGGKVLPVLMPGKRFVSFTDEVPRSSSPRLISRFYKALPKGSSDAPAAGTATPWPRFQGCLQRQSTSSLGDGGKAKPQSDSRATTGSWDRLASAKKRSLTPGGPRRTVPPRGEKVLPRRCELPILRAEFCPSQESYAPACGRGRPVREIRSLAKYEESTSLRQRGGGGFGLPLTHRTRRRLSRFGHASPRSLPWAGQRDGRSAENVSRIERDVDRGSLSPQRGEGRGEGCEQRLCVKCRCSVSTFGGGTKGTPPPRFQIPLESFVTMRRCALGNASASRSSKLRQLPILAPQ